MPLARVLHAFTAAEIAAALGVRGKHLPPSRYHPEAIVVVEDLPAKEAFAARADMVAAGGWGHVLSQPGELSHWLVLGGDRTSFDRWADRVRHRAHGFPAVVAEVQRALVGYGNERPTWVVGDRTWTFERTVVVGVVNVTPDSFSDGGKFLDRDAAVEHGRSLVAEGADLLDLGGESTRPGAEPVSEEEEWRRVGPVLESLAEETKAPLSVDTFKPGVADRALRGGATIVNDVTGLRDPKMVETIARHGASAVLMHMQGDPRTMQEHPAYDDVVGDIYRFFRERLAAAQAAGLPVERIVLDPGVGFGKTLEHNLTILRRLRELRSAGRPVLVGTSRKSFIGTVLDLPVDQRLEGSIATMVAAILHGADLVRVHDVKESVRAARLADALRKTNVLK